MKKYTYILIFVILLTSLLQLQYSTTTQLRYNNIEYGYCTILEMIIFEGNIHDDKYDNMYTYMDNTLYNNYNLILDNSPEVYPLKLIPE